MVSAKHLAGFVLAAVTFHSPCAAAIRQTFNSTKLEAAVITSNKTGSDNPGYYWVEPDQGGDAAGGAQLIADDATLIWRDPTKLAGTNFNLQTVKGEQFLTAWQGDQSPLNGNGYGGIAFLDSTYTQRYNVCVTAADIVRYPGTPVTQPCLGDYHESRMTTRESMLQTGRNVTTHNLKYLGGPEKGYVLNSLFFETHVATNDLVFTWSPLDHLDQYDSLAACQFRLPPGNNGTSPAEAWDFFHMNAVAQVPEPLGGYLVSSRPLSSVFKLDRAGNIEWVIDGRNVGGNFTVATAAKFQYQHDVVPVSATGSTLTFSLFNNDNCDRVYNLGPSAGLILKADIKAKTVKLVKKFQGPPPRPESQHGGSTQPLPSGTALVSYGGTNFIQEYDATGAVVNALQIIQGSSYRAYKYDGWVGMPAAPPDVAGIYDPFDNVTSVYASWNGATEVATWQSAQMMVNRTGFETRIDVPGFVSPVRAVAFNASGAVIGQSGFVRTTGGP